MDDLTDNALFLDAVDAVVLDVSERIGDDPRMRFALFTRLLEVAREMVGETGQSSSATKWRPHLS